MQWRFIGPTVPSGRITDIAVSEQPDPMRGGYAGQLIYVAAATGGVFKTENNGTTWTAVFDHEGSASIGTVALSYSNPNIVWVGTGEANNQRGASYGDGLYKSEDGGASWTHVGFPSAGHIGRIAIHPSNPQIVYVAIPGPLWGNGGDRGLYKTTDGGATWKNTKPINSTTGFIDVVMDPENPDILYAAAYQRGRNPVVMMQGGPESGIYKTMDAGATWTKLTNGLPADNVGRIGLSIARSQPRTVYAVITNSDAGGVYRSDDYGASWRLMKKHEGYSDYYYGIVHADPSNAERVYVLTGSVTVSEDGGKTERYIGNGVFGDMHQIWIDPYDPDHLITASDVGLDTSYDRGETWDFAPNLPLAQFYAISADNSEPFYRVCGGLQDTATICGPSRTREVGGIAIDDWKNACTECGDGSFTPFDPQDNNTFYGASPYGDLIRIDTRTWEQKHVSPDPDFRRHPQYRWAWSAPVIVSPHDHNKLYYGANVLLVSPDRGDTWQVVSGDLTRGDVGMRRNPEWPADVRVGHQGTALYGNITALDESPLQKDLIYAGTDDGLIQVTRDAGKTWQKFEDFPGVPRETYVSRIVASAHERNRVYATFNNYRRNDVKPYVLVSEDNGQHWTGISSNLAAKGMVNVIREDAKDPDLLFVGTETSVFYSIDRGKSWERLKNGIPTVPVYDLVLQAREGDLIAGTYGRGIYVLDDISPLRKLAEAQRASAPVLFPVRDAMVYLPTGISRGPSGRWYLAGDRTWAGANPPYGALIHYYVPEKSGKSESSAGTKESKGESAVAQNVILIRDEQGKLVRQLPVETAPGLHLAAWDLRYETVFPLAKATTRSGIPEVELERTTRGPRVLPGTYKVELHVGAFPVTQTTVVVKQDPIEMHSEAEIRAAHEFRMNVAKLAADAASLGRTASEMEKQLERAIDAVERVDGPADVKQEIRELAREAADIVVVVQGPRPTSYVATNDPSILAVDSVEEAAGHLSMETDNVNSAPTELQRYRLNLSQEEAAQSAKRIDALRGKLAELEKRLALLNISWTSLPTAN
jgi:photosystem II stability/assembly factor-like uncharacterized protein